MDLNIVVSGNIVTELSEKIPSNIIALNELIKNAYDAEAKEVIITLDTVSRRLIVSDDGCGMNSDVIKKLLHIGTSEKQYGRLKSNGRYTQGSKGLGFLSTFKFGQSKVIWDTYKDNVGKRFELNYQDIIKTPNIQNYKINEKKSLRNSHGTTIEMSLDEYNCCTLKEYFCVKDNLSKILYSFIDDNFKIVIKIDEKEYNNCEVLDLKTIVPERALFNVKYNSKIGKIQFIYNSAILGEYDFSLSSDEYQINLDIVVYDLSDTKIGGCGFNSLFMHEGKITPLVYINNNYFDNYTLYDVDMVRRIKASKALPQQIGFINIISDSKDMSFNSDRTNFSQNTITDAIKQDLVKLNREIQEKGSILKNKYKSMQWFIDNNNTIGSLKNDNYITYIDENFIYRDKIKINVQENQVVFNLFGRKIYKNLSKTNEEIVKEESKNEQTNINNSNNLKSMESNHVGAKTEKDFSSATETNKNNSKPNIPTPNKVLFSMLPKKDDYKWNFKTILPNLIEELNKLKMNSYFNVIACCLRPIFELSAQELKLSSHFSELQNKGTEHIIEFVIGKVNNNAKTCIENSTGIGYKDLNNIIIEKDFIDSYKKSNLSAHKSGENLSIGEIDTIIKYASCFMILVNEFLGNEDLQKIVIGED